MIIGIVGPDLLKIGSNSQLYFLLDKAVWEIIRDNPDADFASGGASGVDYMAKSWATKENKKFKEFIPVHDHWECGPGCYGYKARNTLLANHVDKMYCVTWKTSLPTCYHCFGRAPAHQLSGGCWTMRYAERLGKEVALVIV